MTASVDTPVVLILFNRPKRVRELIDVLRCVRPTRILAVADGPRDTHADDVSACADARSALDGIDWPHTIERDFASKNLGCNRRVASGLDWAFSRTERAIVLEDDILPDPSFFSWATAMLDRFGDEPDVAMISGQNPLGRWGEGDPDHLRVRRGGIWGWATTARAWRRANACDLGGDPERAHIDAASPGVDPLLVERFGILLRSYRHGELAAWDVTFELRNFMLGATAVVPPVNLVRNNGIGPGATHTLFEDDFNALIPVGNAPQPRTSVESMLNDRFDRAVLLTELMSRCVDPRMARRLAVRLGSLPLDEASRHHLAPFTVPGESLELLEHLAAQDVSSPHFDLLLKTFREAASATSRNP